MNKFLLVITLMYTCSSVKGQTIHPQLKITQLTGNFYIYTTYSIYEGSQIPANGMYLVTDNGIVLFDTPWDTTQFQPLLDSLMQKHNKPVSICIATHWHSDRTEGLEYYRKLGIKTFTTFLTDEWSKRNNKKRAEYLMSKDTVFNIGNYSFEVFYPGEGHTADNIIIWFPKEKILYGGCLIKGVQDKTLGYLGDANINEYETTLRKVKKKCTAPNYIIISHSDWNNNNSLQHSIKLAKKLKKKKDNE
jgi:metallo-beta-lactamase class B